MDSSSLSSASAPAPIMNNKLEGKVAIITGGASGIGAASARLFCRHGAKVVVADIQDELGESLCAELGRDWASFVHCDVTDEEHVRMAVDHAVDKFGKLDIMFNNAGIGQTAKPSIVDNDKGEFERLLSVNLVGPFLGTKHAAGVMIPARRGTIINTSSLASLCAFPTMHAYTCAKHAVVGLTRNTAVELGEFGIRVNCVSLLGVATPLIKWLGITAEEFEAEASALAHLKGLVLKAEDVANAVLFLASEESRFISGHNLVVDGAASIPNPGLSIKFTSDWYQPAGTFRCLLSH